MYSNEDYLLQLLTEAGQITAEDIQSGRSQISGQETVIGYLISKNRLTEEQVAGVLAQNSNMDYYDLSNVGIQPEVIAAMTADIAKRFHACLLYTSPSPRD